MSKFFREVRKSGKSVKTESKKDKKAGACAIPSPREGKEGVSGMLKVKDYFNRRIRNFTNFSDLKSNQFQSTIMEPVSESCPVFLSCRILCEFLNFMLIFDSEQGAGFLN